MLLLDEPLSNLDAQLRLEMRSEIRRICKEAGITTIYVTHDQVEAMGMGDRIAVMNHGKVHQFGTPEEVYNDPSDIFVATFLGSPPMNLLEKGNYVVGFRPEQFLPEEVANEGGPKTEFTYHVNRIEYLGAERYLYGHVRGFDEDTKVIAMLPVTVQVPIATDQDHRFAVAQDKVRYFLTDSGERVDPEMLQAPLRP